MYPLLVTMSVYIPTSNKDTFTRGLLHGHYSCICIVAGGYAKRLSRFTRFLFFLMVDG